MLTRFCRCLVVPARRFTSALYVTGDKAQENFAILTPHLDIDERLANREALERNLNARGLSVDVTKLETRWAFYLTLLSRKLILMDTRTGMGKEISELMKDEEKNRGELEKFRQQLRVIKDEYWVLRNYMYGVEETAALAALNLPNVLHPRTPLENETEVYLHLQKPDHESKSHIEIGAERELIEHTNNSFTFLLNDAALYEQAILNYFHEKLTNSDFIQFSNSDFSKSVIVEGCGGDFENDNEVIALDNGEHNINRLLLTGGASHHAFMAYLTRYSVMNTQLPLKFFASGRKYQPMISDEPSLFNAMQNTAIEIFTATINSDDELDKILDSLIDLVTEIYKPLGIHFRLVLLPANKLCNYESLRLSIQMFSNYKRRYVEVGRISVCDDYLSKRLLFTYNENKERKFSKVIVGDVLNVQKLLACNIENDVNISDLLQNMLQKYVP